MVKELKLGVIGMSEGNGHPYSWAAIFNGYNKKAMAECPFPVIPEYLGKQSFPEDSIKEARVTHIWTQEEPISKKISKASLIPNICSNPEDMIGEVDAVLLARDDAENHFSMSLPYLKAGLPVFIDKPLAYDLKTAKKILNEQEYHDQIFTCSSLRFAKEFNLTSSQKERIGKIIHVDASVPKSWSKYAVHIIEPSLSMLDKNYKVDSVETFKNQGITMNRVQWVNGPSGIFKTFGKHSAPLKITLYGENGFEELEFKDTFFAFKASLQYFIEMLNKKVPNIDRIQTLQVIEILERGMK